ncbi:uncharacterized protein LOC125899183, partial [Scomber scombrus]
MEEKLIMAVCGHPVLYDTAAVFYRDRNKKEEAWAMRAEVGLSDQSLSDSEGTAPAAAASASGSYGSRSWTPLTPKFHRVWIWLHSGMAADPIHFHSSQYVYFHRLRNGSVTAAERLQHIIFLWTLYFGLEDLSSGLIPSRLCAASELSFTHNSAAVNLKNGSTFSYCLLEDGRFPELLPYNGPEERDKLNEEFLDYQSMDISMPENPAMFDFESFWGNMASMKNKRAKSVPTIEEDKHEDEDETTDSPVSLPSPSIHLLFVHGASQLRSTLKAHGVPLQRPLPTHPIRKLLYYTVQNQG